MRGKQNTNLAKPDRRTLSRVLQVWCEAALPNPALNRDLARRNKKNLLTQANFLLSSKTPRHKKKSGGLRHNWVFTVATWFEPTPMLLLEAGEQALTAQTLWCRRWCAVGWPGSLAQSLRRRAQLVGTCLNGRTFVSLSIGVHSYRMEVDHGFGFLVMELMIIAKGGSSSWTLTGTPSRADFGSSPSSAPADLAVL
ncbi:hypothetical protein VNO77_02835 [Canavalia gladiata]|uniref:Uncharacterized protein n=1 Tax=Canavalia gladiata TaxID=3824 RepID=A0AAN9MTN7_CANGL